MEMRRNDDGTITMTFQVTEMRVITTPEQGAEWDAAHPPLPPPEWTTILTVYHQGQRIGWVEEMGDGIRRWCFANEDRHQAARKRNENLPWRGAELLEEAGPLLDAYHPRWGLGVVNTADIRSALANGIAKMNLRTYRRTPERRWI
jgi:hypothetical protein